MKSQKKKRKIFKKKNKEKIEKIGLLFSECLNFCPWLFVNDKNEFSIHSFVSLKIYDKYMTKYQKYRKLLMTFSRNCSNIWSYFYGMIYIWKYMTCGRPDIIKFSFSFMFDRFKRGSNLKWFTRNTIDKWWRNKEESVRIELTSSK